MALIITAIIILGILGASGVAGYMLYRRGLRYAKGIERGLKMVPILINLPPPSEDAEVGGRDARDVMQERISQAEVLYNLIASTATKGFKSKFFGQRHIGFELVAIEGVIRFYAAVPVAMVPVLKQAILTAYPGAHLEEVEDHNIFSEAGKISGTYGGEMTLKQDYVYPIATFNQLKSDAVTGVINSLKSLNQGEGASIQILLRPAREGWAKKSEATAEELREDGGKSGIKLKHVVQAPFKVPGGGGDDDSPPKQLNSIEQSTVEAIEEKTKSTGYEVLIRIVSSANTASQAQAITNNVVASFSLFDAPGLNGFEFKPAKNMEQFVTDFIFRFFPPERSRMILNSIELATLFHFPDDQFTQTSQIQRQHTKQVEGPNKLPSTGLLVGHNEYHGVKKEIRISDSDRRRHVYMVGQTGTGKSTLLENMIVQDMQVGRGFAFVDPHGDAAESILGMIPKERSEDVIYFDPGDLDNPLGLNLFEYHSEDQKDFLIQETINMLYRLYDPTRMGIIGPRYEHLFRNAALTVMADPAGGTFVDIPKLFRDPQFVKEKLKHVEDQTVLEFWQKEMPQSQRSSDFGEIVSWFVSKFGAFLSNQMMRNIIGQSRSAFDLREVMDSNKILIANLSKGRLGELNSQLLGMIFVMKFQAAAMSRANQPESERIDFSLYIDEFQNFSTESFAHILSEARKYHLNMIVANQFISQLSEEVREAVFGNVGTIISYRTGPNDADFLVKQFSPTFNERDLVNLPNFVAAVRLMVDNVPTQPFNLTALPPLGSSNPQLAQALKQLSAVKYGKPRQEVEDEIFERLSTKPAPSPFDSLASSQETDKQDAPSRQAPASTAANTGATGGSSPGSGGDSSFLDEWLAKRRQAMPSQSSPASGASASSQSEPGSGPRQSVPPPSGGNQPAGSAGQPAAGPDAPGSTPAPAQNSFSAANAREPDVNDQPDASRQPQPTQPAEAGGAQSRADEHQVQASAPEGNARQVSTGQGEAPSPGRSEGVADSQSTNAAEPAGMRQSGVSGNDQDAEAVPYPQSSEPGGVPQSTDNMQQSPSSDDVPGGVGFAQNQHPVRSSEEPGFSEENGDNQDTFQIPSQASAGAETAQASPVGAESKGEPESNQSQASQVPPSGTGGEPEFDTSEATSVSDVEEDVDAVAPEPQKATQEASGGEDVTAQQAAPVSGASTIGKSRARAESEPESDSQLQSGIGQERSAQPDAGAAASDNSQVDQANATAASSHQPRTVQPPDTSQRDTQVEQMTAALEEEFQSDVVSDQSQAEANPGSSSTQDGQQEPGGGAAISPQESAPSPTSDESATSTPSSEKPTSGNVVAPDNNSAQPQRTQIDSLDDNTEGESLDNAAGSSAVDPEQLSAPPSDKMSQEETIDQSAEADQTNQASTKDDSQKTQQPVDQQKLVSELSQELGAPVEVTPAGSKQGTTEPSSREDTSEAPAQSETGAITTPQPDNSAETATESSGSESTNSSDSPVVNLQPGEVYIDEEGTVHRG